MSDGEMVRDRDRATWGFRPKPRQCSEPTCDAVWEPEDIHDRHRRCPDCRTAQRQEYEAERKRNTEGKQP
jgi:hypothetical protein